MAKKKGNGKGTTPRRTPQRSHAMRLSGDDEAGAGARPAKMPGSAQKTATARGGQQHARPGAVRKNVTFDDSSDKEDATAVDDGWTSNLSDDEPDVDPVTITLKEAGGRRADAVFWKWRDSTETKNNQFKCPKRGNKPIQKWLNDTILGCNSPEVRWILSAIKAGDMTGGAPVLHDWHLKKCRKRKVGTDSSKSFKELYETLPEKEWLSTHLHLERVERLCRKVHAKRVDALKENPHAVFTVPQQVKDSPAWIAWDSFDQILGQRTMQALSALERKMHSVEYAKMDDSAGRGHIHSESGAVSGAWLWARMLTSDDEDIGFEAIEKLSTCFTLSMEKGQFERYRTAFLEAKDDLEGTIGNIDDFEMPALMWVALFVAGGHADVVLPLRELLSSSGESILSLSLPQVIKRFRVINKTHKERRK